MESFADIIVKNATRMSELVVDINGSAVGASNPSALFFAILSTLEFGLDNDDETVCRRSLIALGAWLRRSYESKRVVVVRLLTARY